MSTTDASKPAKTVSIVGAGLSLANYWESADEIWAVPRAAMLLHQKGYKIHKVFSGDDLRFRRFNLLLGVRVFENKDIYEFLTTKWPFGAGTQLYTGYANQKWWPHSVTYPIKKIVEMFNTDYINHSTPMMLAYALASFKNGDYPSEVHIHGMDFTDDERGPDRSGHRGCSEYWMGRMHEAGMILRVNPACHTLDTDEISARGFRLRGFGNEIVKHLPTTRKERFNDWNSGKWEFDIATEKIKQENPGQFEFDFPGRYRSKHRKSKHQYRVKTDKDFLKL